jgi:peptide-methionine (S)-S-oxide reductase
MEARMTEPQHEIAILAGGCFWGMEALIRRLPGVLDTHVGYTGGQLQNPTYNDMRTGTTGHAEAIAVMFDPSVLSYRTLLAYFFQIHDPSTPNRQGNDIGTQYRSAIFYQSDTQKHIAETVIAAIDASGLWPGKVATELLPAGTFYDAEGYHQDYLEKNPNGYTCHFPRKDWVLPE